MTGRARAVRPGRLRPLVLPALVAGAAAASVAAVVLRDPHVPGSWGLCPVYVTSGLYCPGCGGMRAVHDLAHLQVGSALSSNLVTVALVLLAAVVWAAWTWSRVRGRPVDWSRWITPVAGYVTVGLLVAFTVLRNLPVGAFLTPAAL